MFYFYQLFMKHLIVNMYIKQSLAKSINPLGALTVVLIYMHQAFHSLSLSKILVKVVITLKV